jgi:hypothetical protein
VLVRRGSELLALPLAASCTALLVSELYPIALSVLIQYQSKLNTRCKEQTQLHTLDCCQTFAWTSFYGFFQLQSFFKLFRV